MAIGGVAALALWSVGVVGYVAIEGFSVLDAVYQTITVVTTAGFGEVNPLGTGGRIFTIVLIILGIMVVLYILTAVMQIAVEGELESILGARRMKGKIETLHDHYILSGFGRVGDQIAGEFTDRKVSFVIVESVPESLERARKKGYLIIEGDAATDGTLLEAGGPRAPRPLAAPGPQAG